MSELSASSQGVAQQEYPGPGEDLSAPAQEASRGAGDLPGGAGGSRGLRKVPAAVKKRRLGGQEGSSQRTCNACGIRQFYKRMISPINGKMTGRCIDCREKYGPMSRVVPPKECECGTYITRAQKVCARCRFLDGTSERQAEVIGILRGHGGSATWRTVMREFGATHDEGCNAYRTLRRAIVGLKNKGRVRDVFADDWFLENPAFKPDLHYLHLVEPN